MLAGIYTVLPLQGSLDLLSTTISPSPSTSPLPVFAPSSHPIPIVTRSEASATPSPSQLLAKLPLPSTFQLADSRAVFLVREHDCGMQGLRGGIVPGFSTIWGEERGAWGLRSVHPVRPPRYKTQMRGTLIQNTGAQLRWYKHVPSHYARIVAGAPTPPLDYPSGIRRR